MLDFNLQVEDQEVRLKIFIAKIYNFYNFGASIPHDIHQLATFSTKICLVVTIVE